MSLLIIPAAVHTVTETSAMSVIATVGTICAILFGLIGAVFTILYFSERKKARTKAEGMIEGNLNAVLDNMTSNQSVILDNVKEIRDTQNANHLSMCERMVGVEKVVEKHTEELSILGRDVRKIQEHIWTEPRGQFDVSDAPEGTLPMKQVNPKKK